MIRQVMFAELWGRLDFENLREGAGLGALAGPYHTSSIDHIGGMGLELCFGLASGGPPYWPTKAPSGLRGRLDFENIARFHALCEGGGRAALLADQGT